MQARPAFKGANRALVLAIDIGTTYSGASYAFLDPGRPPVIENVLRYPAKDGRAEDHKIPTVILYGPNGDVRAVGAETQDESFLEGIMSGELVKAEWFKLHLCPQHLRTSQIFNSIPPLPLGKSIVTVFADFLRYLFKCVKKFIIESHHNGDAIWHSKHDIVLTHPNGWEGAQQAAMRQAAIEAGLIPDNQEGRDSIHFVTEGEASLHFCLSNGLVPRNLREGDAVLVVDAGGGTIDVTAYEQSDMSMAFKESAVPQCHFHGSMFVTQHAKTFLRDFLSGSRYLDAIDDITKCFDETTKLQFRDPNLPSFIKFGTMRDSDTDHNIRFGSLRLAGDQVAKFYEPTIDCISRVILGQHRQNVGEGADQSDLLGMQMPASNGLKSQPYHTNKIARVNCVLLVGGFAGSSWLYTSLKDKFESYNVLIVRPERHSSKAATNGAASFYLDHFVHGRISKNVYGIECSPIYNHEDPEHVQRQATKYTHPEGSVRLPGAFDIILPRGIEVEETQEFRQQYRLATSALSDLSIPIYCYRGPQDPRWMFVGPSEDWDDVCTVIASASSLDKIFKHHLGKDEPYFTLDLDIILLFGLTELQAQICWRENGRERRGPASIIYRKSV